LIELDEIAASEQTAMVTGPAELILGERHPAFFQTLKFL
jgi:hypothetical protein